MKSTLKKLLAVVGVVLLSSSVAAIITYQICNHISKNSSANLQLPTMEQTTMAAYAEAPQTPIDLTQAAERSLHAVVHIKATVNSKRQTVQQEQQIPDIFDFFFGQRSQQQRQQQSKPQVGFGSGVIISKDGYIVTNNHVVESADEIDVTLNDNTEYKARLIGTDPNTDLALIKIEGNTDFPIIPIGNSDALKVGEWVLAVGNPFNLTSTVTAGIVSAKARSLGVYDGGIESFIQTDAAINKGNSGGALVNARGELVGINAILMSPSGTYSGYGFAIPTTIMTKVVADLKEYGAVQRALLGIKGGDLKNAKESDSKLKEQDFGVVDGVYVAEITEGGAAAGADIKVGDVIIAIGGKHVKNMAELQECVAQHRPGDKVKVTVVRDKKERTIEVTLVNAQGNTKVVKSSDIQLLGAAFKEVGDNLKKQLRLTHGLQVTGIQKGKLQEAGIQKGFIILKVNGTAIRTLSDLENVLKAASQSPEQVLFITGIYPAGRRANYAVELSQE